MFLSEEIPFFILQLSPKFTFRPKCFIWYKIDPKLCPPAQPHGSADSLVYSHLNGSIPSSTTPHRHLRITRPTAPTVLREEERKEHVERSNCLVHHVQIGRSFFTSPCVLYQCRTSVWYLTPLLTTLSTPLLSGSVGREIVATYSRETARKLGFMLAETGLGMSCVGGKDFVNSGFQHGVVWFVFFSKKVSRMGCLNW